MSELKQCHDNLLNFLYCIKSNKKFIINNSKNQMSEMIYYGGKWVLFCSMLGLCGNVKMILGKETGCYLDDVNRELYLEGKVDCSLYPVDGGACAFKSTDYMYNGEYGQARWEYIDILIEKLE